MTEEENKAIEEFKRVIDFVSSGTGIVEIRKFDVHYYETILNLIDKLKKEITNGMEREENLKDSLMEIIETLKLENNVVGQDTIIQEIVRLQDENEDSIPKDKIKGKIKEYNKEIKTYEDKMLEITQREKHQAIENKDFIKYSCIISNFTDKIKLLKNLIEEE